MYDSLVLQKALKDLAFGHSTNTRENTMQSRKHVSKIAVFFHIKEKYSSYVCSSGKKHSIFYPVRRRRQKVYHLGTKNDLAGSSGLVAYTARACITQSALDAIVRAFVGDQSLPMSDNSHINVTKVLLGADISAGGNAMTKTRETAAAQQYKSDSDVMHVFKRVVYSIRSIVCLADT